MAARLREALSHWANVQQVMEPENWKCFLLAISNAHEADLLSERDRMEKKLETKGCQRHEIGMSMKDLKPEAFDSNEKSKQSFKQWSDEFMAWTERMDQEYEALLRIVADLDEWDAKKFVKMAEDDMINEDKVREFNKELYTAMKRLTTGTAREIVDTSKTAAEAWYRLSDRFYGRTVQGATAIAGQLQELKRPAQISESFHLLNVIRKLVKEFTRQSPKEPMPSSIIKAAYMKVVPETYRKALETQVDVDKVEPHLLEEKVLAFIRNNTSSAVPMDIGNVGLGELSHSGAQWNTSLGYSAGAESWAPTTYKNRYWAEEPYPNLNSWECSMHHQGDDHAQRLGGGFPKEENYGEIYGLQKGKGYKGKGGGFVGNCYNCGKAGHSAKYCMSSPKGKGKGKGKGKKGDSKGDGKGWWQQGKEGWHGKGMDSFDREDEGELDMLVLERWRPEEVESEWKVPVRHVKNIRKGNKKERRFDIEYYLDPDAVEETEGEHEEAEEPKDEYSEGSTAANIHKGGEEGSKARRSRNQRRVEARMKRNVHICGQETLDKHENKAEVGMNLFEKGNKDLCEFTQNEWTPLPKPLVVDSGAGETVMPSDWFPAHATTESDGSRSNDFYTTADGTKVFNEGQKRVDVCTLDGQHCRTMTFQLAKVRKALGSVSQMVRNGNRLVFDQDAQGKDISFVQNKKSGEKIWLRQENGVYVLDLLVGPPRTPRAPQHSEPHFRRQG